MMQSFDNTDPRLYGHDCFQAAVQFPPHGKYTCGQVDGLPHFKGKFFSYLECKSKLLQQLTTEYVHFPGLIPAWGNTPRVQERATIFAGSSPATYEDWLRKACAFVQQNNTEQERFVFVNAWNEWAEGAHLEPCKTLGYAYLNATSRVLARY